MFLKISQHITALLLFLLITFACFGQKEIVLKTHPNGKASIVGYYKGKGNNMEKVKEVGYYPNGKKDYEGSFKNGKEHGKWIYYYENGQKMYEELYKNGLEEGKHYEWAPDGQLKKVEIYKKGKLIQVIEY